VTTQNRKAPVTRYPGQRTKTGWSGAYGSAAIKVASNRGPQKAEVQANSLQTLATRGTPSAHNWNSLCIKRRP
jgi:hypothetical protein